MDASVDPNRVCGEIRIMQPPTNLKKLLDFGSNRSRRMKKFQLYLGYTVLLL